MGRGRGGREGREREEMRQVIDREGREMVGWGRKGRSVGEEGKAVGWEEEGQEEKKRKGKR